MNLFEEFLVFLQKEMPTPVAFDWFHLLCIFIMLCLILFLFLIRKKHNEKQLKIVVGTYGIVAFILELLKQLIWAYSFDTVTGIGTWEYTWYAFPFQLCSTPIYISIISLFLKKGHIRDSLYSYLSFYTILGSITTILIPDSCFTSDILVNIHTMFLHLGSFVVSIYLLFSKEIKINFSNLLKGFIVFLINASIALFLNIFLFKTNIILDHTFNMFYISPYFISSLPVYDIIQQNTPYIIFLLIYLISIYLGGSIIFIISYLINKFISNKKST